MCINVCMYIYIYIYTYIYMYMYVCVCVFIFRYIDIYIYMFRCREKVPPRYPVAARLLREAPEEEECGCVYVTKRDSRCL